MMTQEMWNQENAGNYGDLSYTTVAEGRGEGCGFSYLLESRMTYLAGHTSSGAGQEYG
jgi:hypothetical protein